MAPFCADMQEEGLRWIGVAIRTSADKAMEFADQNKLPFVNLVDPEKKVSEKLQTPATPYTLLLDKDRKVVSIYQGSGSPVLSVLKKDAREFITAGKVTSQPVGAGLG